MSRYLLGFIALHDSVDITDPCYNRDVLGRMNDVPVSSGTYRCYVWTKAETYRDEYKVNARFAVGTRIKAIGVSLGEMPKLKEMKCIGAIDVDAGLAGFFKYKPDFDDLQWSKFCDDLFGYDAFINEYGVYSSSGYGDGSYNVYAKRDANGKATALYIRFI